MERTTIERELEVTSGRSSTGKPAKGKGKDPEKSPEKKKSQTNVDTPDRSTLKTGWYACPSTPGPERMHLHKHKHAIIEAGLSLDSNKRFEHLVSAVSSFIKYCQLVHEQFVINPIYEGGRNKDWVDAHQIPASMTELGAYLKLSGSSRIFDKPKSGQGNAKMPTVYFSFAVSSNILPEEILARVNVDWNILRGTRLAVKNLGVFDTVTPMVIYFLWNDGHGPTILQELQQILSTVAPVLLGGEQAELPSMALRKQVP
jgi:hypothetical protein